jgi:RHS repeat-associated protein
VLDAQGTKVAESRHFPYGEERWRWPEDSTFPTDYRFTGQRDAGLGLYHMGARFYDSSLNRFLSPDSIIPQPGNPQSFNRYSYVNNRPLVAIDPTGHDLVIVGGRGADVDPEAMWELWQGWIMAYKGWTQEFWKGVYDAWSAAVREDGLAAGNTVLAEHGIHLFTWGGSTVQEAESNARSAKNWEMLGQLSEEMEGMHDITLVGWSKGGNLVMEYLQALDEGQNLTRPKHVVLIAPANTTSSEAARGIRHVSPKVPQIGINVANICAGHDPICDTSLQGAINFTKDVAGHGTLGHGPHGHLAPQVFAALYVAHDYNAWDEDRKNFGRRDW